MLANYTSGTLVYRELIVFSHATARGMVVSHIYVDDEQSLQRRARRSGACRRSSPSSATRATRFTARQGDAHAAATRSIRRRPGGSRSLIPAPIVSDAGATLGRARIKAAPALVTLDVPPNSPFAHLGLSGTRLGARRRRPALTMPARRPRLSAQIMRQNLRPLFDRVVVKELEPDRIRQSGLLVPAGTHEPPPQHGIVLAVGPGLDWWEGAGIAMPVKPGDHVVFPASAGAWVEVDEERLLVCRVGELLGVLEEVKEPVPT